MRPRDLVRWSILATVALVLHASEPVRAACQFPVASTPQPELALGVASDGSGFLVGIQGDALDPHRIGAQLVSSSGTLVGPLIPTNRTGGGQQVAFGAGTYLLAWTDDLLFPDGDIWGMFISPAGVAGAPFPIAGSAFDEELDGLAYDGTNFLAVYEADQSAPPGRFMKGRFVTPAGSVGAPFTISTNPGANGFHCVAFGGGNYLVAWNDDATNLEVRARSVTPAGALGAEFLVNASSSVQDGGVGVASDGSSFMVVWTREIGGPGTMEWDVIAQRASAGATIGSPIAVADWMRGQAASFVAFDGANYLVTWTEASNDIDKDGLCDANESTCWDVSARFLSPTGALGAAPFSVVTEVGDQFASPLAWNGASYLVAWSEGSFNGPSGDVLGKLVSPPAIQPPASYCTSKVNSSGCTPLVTWSGTPQVGNPGPFTVGAINVLNNKTGLLFYSSIGAQALTFQGGYLCGKAPIQRTALQSSMGNPPPNDCSGSYSFDFNAYIATGQDPALVAGRTVWAQNWSRDPGFPPPDNTGLTNAVAFTIAP